MIVFPNAKINLGLNIISKRDDGYHNINTIFLPLKKVVDILEVIHLQEDEQQDRLTISGFEIPGKSDENFCLKALNIMRNYAKIPPLNIFLHKIIPFGAGLGGGSADAAFMLKLLNEMFEVNFTDEKLEIIASSIGADCAFFIKNKITFAEETGNIFSPVNINIPKFWLELVVPPIEVSTVFAYQNIKPCKPNSDLKKAISLPVEMWRNLITNDFEAPVFKQFPVLKRIKDTLYKNGAIYASMSGSGSAVYGLFNNEPKINWDKSFFVHSDYLEFS